MFPTSFPAFVGPDEEIKLSETLPASTCWWQLARLYAGAQRSDELLGWLCDRWSGPTLERLGGAITAKGLGDYEGALTELSDVS